MSGSFVSPVTAHVADLLRLVLSSWSHLRISFLQRYSRWWMSAVLGISDTFSLLLAAFLAVGLRSILWGGMETPEKYLRIWPLIFFFIFVYAWRGLYPAVGLSPVEELRRLAGATNVVFLILAAYSAMVHNAETYSRAVFGFAWLFALIFVQISRWIVRIVAVRLGLWGEPVAVIGYGPQGQKIVEFLSKNMRLGLRPALIIDGFGAEDIRPASIPVLNLGSSEVTGTPWRLSKIRTAIMIISEMPEALQTAVIDEGRFGFNRLITISALGWIGSLGVMSYDLEGILGLEVRQNLLNPWERTLKRTLELCIVLIGGVLAMPLIMLIALVIRLESKGPVFYGHERVGKGGGLFKTWKFRTMVPNAGRILADYLSQHPQARAEWDATQKLKNDPRVTRVGKMLRKLSLDELPQLWNVLKGEMSLVGPRPIVKEEIQHYRNAFTLYTRVPPGITGMWQVSGRNDLSYDLRVQMDEYYVRNWSTWLDIYILLRTGWVVLRRNGAY